MPYSRAYYERTKESRREYQKAYQKKYRDSRTPEERERASEKQKEWRIANPDACDRHVANRKKETA